MRFEHDAPRLLRAAIERRPGGAVGIIFHAVGELPRIGGPFALAGQFEAGGAGCVEEVE
jgi:hypothetical protein